MTSAYSPPTEVGHSTGAATSRARACSRALDCSPKNAPEKLNETLEVNRSASRLNQPVNRTHTGMGTVTACPVGANLPVS